MSSSSELKNIDTRHKAASQEMNVLNIQYKEIIHRIETLRREISDLDKRKDALTSDVVVTEHAMLRYLERMELVNFDQLREMLLPENVKEQIKVLGNGKYPVAGGKIVVNNGRVVTWLSKENL